MNTLYYSPGACSLAVHAVLEEIGAPFEKKLIALSRGEHETEAYTNINPLQRVPVLHTEHGILTEAAAILQYLARTHPEAKLLPGDPALARAQEWLNFLASVVHPAFTPIFKPKRFAEDEAGQKWVAAHYRARAHELLVHAAARLGSGPWALGDTFSVVDPYLFVFVYWGKRFGFPSEHGEPLTTFAKRAVARPSIARALAAEGIDATRVV